MPDVSSLPTWLQWAIYIGTTMGVTAFVVVGLFWKFGSWLGIHADQGLAEMIAIVGPKPDSKEAEHEAKNPTTLVGVAKRTEARLDQHIKNFADFRRIVAKEFRGVKDRVGTLEDQVGVRERRRSR